MKLKDIYSKELFIKKKKIKGEKVHPVSIRKIVFGSYYSLTKEMCVHHPVLGLLNECEGNTSIQTVTAGGFQHWCEATCFWTNGYMKMCCTVRLYKGKQQLISGE